MISLIVTRSHHQASEPFQLRIRQHDLGGTDYTHVAFISEHAAYAIVDSGEASFLYGDPRYQTTPAPPKPVYKPYWNAPKVKPIKIGPCAKCSFDQGMAYCKGMVCPRRDEFAEAGLI